MHTLRSTAYGLVILVLLSPGASSAQAPGRFSLAIGPAVTLADAPPSGGVHARGAYSLRPPTHRLNLELDGYVSWLPFGSHAAPPTQSGSWALDETQLGLGLGVQFHVLPRRPIVPFLAIGAVVRHSILEMTPAFSGPDSASAVSLPTSGTTTTGDVFVGAGALLPLAGRFWRFEARLYGGSVLYMPLTVGLSW